MDLVLVLLLHLQIHIQDIQVVQVLSLIPLQINIFRPATCCRGWCTAVLILDIGGISNFSHLAQHSTAQPNLTPLGTQSEDL